MLRIVRLLEADAGVANSSVLDRKRKTWRGIASTKDIEQHNVLCHFQMIGLPTRSAQEAAKWEKYNGREGEASPMD